MREGKKPWVVVCRVLDDEDSQPASFWPQATKKEAEMGDVEMQKRGIKWPSGPQYTGPKPSLLLLSRLLFWPQVTKKIDTTAATKYTDSPYFPSRLLDIS
jgi:hypothetical protein